MNFPSPATRLDCVSPVWAKRFAYASLTLMLALQAILIVCYYNTPQLSDYGAHIGLAQECFDRGVWYPSYHNLHDKYILAPALINLLILELKIFGTVKCNMLLNVLLNLGVLVLTFSLTKKYFSEFVAWMAIGLTCLMYSTWWVVVPASTELPFLFLGLLGLYCSLKGKYAWCFAGGAALALANNIRPLALLYAIVAAVGIIVQQRAKLRKALVMIAAMVAGAIAVAAVIGCLSKQTCGETILQSSTGGANLIQTANDRAYGGVHTYLFSDSTTTLYIKNEKELTYHEKDSIWKARSLEWIKKHPGKYVKLCLIKVPGLFSEDSWPDRSVLPGSGFVQEFVNGRMPMSEFAPIALSRLGKSFVYYVILIIFVYSVVVNRKSILTAKGIWLLLVAGGVAGTCLMPVSPRYHYPFLFAIVMWAAYGVETWLLRRQTSKR